MNKYFKKFSIMFVMSLVLVFGSCVSAFASSSVDIDRSTCLPSETVNVDYKIDNISSKPWIGIVSHNLPHDRSGRTGSWYGNWKWISNTSGKISLIAPTTAGKYDIRIFSDYDNYKEIASSQELEVIAISNSRISLDNTALTLLLGESQQLTATTTPASVQLEWSAGDESIASVDQKGKVTGIKEGKATITAKIKGTDIKATCVVTVTNNTVPVEPQPTDSDKIVNVAHAKGDNTNNAGGDVIIIFHGSADTTLSVVKIADVKDVWVGDNFTYTLVITNTGTKTAKAVVVNDPAPNHIDFNVSGVTTTQGTVDSSSTSKNIIVNAGDILPGGTVTIKIPATVI